MKKVLVNGFLPVKGIPVIMVLMLLSLSFLFSACKKTDYHGFRLKDKQFVAEINAECLIFEHEKSGARLMKISNDDENKTFCITFRTFPESDNGSPHIMEHSVLNGSKNFPVKSPFDVLSKGSLSTFMNAFTSKDFTMYPVASMNEKDYFNLMYVYLDAVFNPLIYTDPRIMQQEGWHFELTDQQGPLTYKGVVYNEMKGAFSDPAEELSYQIYKNLFPDNAYGLESGGYPGAIPTLTNASFLDFHRKYYHPENSYILLYGNGDLDKELAFIDSAYLSNYTRTNRQPGIEDQKPFPAMKEVTAFYPVMEGADTKNQTYLAMDWVIGHSYDYALSMSLDVLAEALVNQESAPVRLALQKAGIGQDVSASTANYKQNVFEIVVQNANPGDQAKFKEVIINTLKEIAQKGLDKKDLEGIINRMEFRLREGNDAQKGLTYLGQAIQGWFFTDDPITGMRYEKPLAEVKGALTSNYLEEIIRKNFLENPHSLLTALEPKPGLEKERGLKTDAELQAIKSTLTADSLDKIITSAKDLLAYQQREDTPEAIATIPMLKASDINPKSTWYEVKEETIAGVPVLHHETFTNNVVYVRNYFDIRVLPQELIPYGSLLTNLLGIMNTKNYTYAALNQELNRNTGGFSFSLSTLSENMDDNKLLPKIVMSTKVMPEKLDKMSELGLEILNSTKFDDPERLKTVLTRHQAQLEEELKSDGYSVASRRAPSYFTKQGVYSQLTQGIDYYHFITDITKNFEVKSPEVSEKLRKVAEMLFVRENMIFAVTCDAKQISKVKERVELIAGGLKTGTPVMATWNLEPVKKNEGLMAPSKVQYVIAGYDYKKLGYTWNGKMRVLSQVLSTDWLQQRIRVMGGAYGGWCSISADGQMLFNSYRDPNLKGTLDNYMGTVEYLQKFKADETDMTRYIIGTIAGMDQPLTPAGRGDRAFRNYFSKRTAKEIQDDRDAVLATKAEDIRGFAKLVQDVLDQKAWCVYGNADRLKSEKQLFNQLVGLD